MPSKNENKEEINFSSDEAEELITTDPVGLDADDFEDERYDEHVETELKATSTFLAQNTGSSHTLPGILTGANSWQTASDIVSTFRPVPRLMWSIVNAVFGKSMEQKGDSRKTASKKKINPMIFFAVSPLVIRASTDDTLQRRKDEIQTKEIVTLTKAADLLGTDVCAAVCFIHAICRRITKRMSERMWKPILDDALLRAQIGYHVGLRSRLFGPGRGMLVGFSGRAGLAIQIASGGTLQAQHTLAALATGAQMGEVGMSFYGCDPLQVSAMTLVAAGCNRDAAYGTASFSSRRIQPAPNSEQHRWLAAFTIIEHVRMGSGSLIGDEYWFALDYDDPARAELKDQVKLIQRRGHSWDWLTRAHIEKE